MVSAYRVGSLASKDRMLARHMDQPAHPAPLAYLELRLPSLRLPAPRVIVVSMITGSLMKPVGCLVLAMNPRRTNTRPAHSASQCQDEKVQNRLLHQLVQHARCNDENWRVKHIDAESILQQKTCMGGLFVSFIAKHRTSKP